MVPICNDRSQLKKSKGAKPLAASLVEGGSDPPTASEASEGLVFDQQSSQQGAASSAAGCGYGPKPFVKLSPEALQRLKDRKRQHKERMRRIARQQTTAPAARLSRHYRAVIESEDETFTIDSIEARIRRCQRRVHAWATALPKDNRKIRRAQKALNIGPRLVMLTLTYEDKDAWEPNQIRGFMTFMRRLLGESLLAYAWVVEMQRREAPHYHVLLYVKRGTRIPKPDESLWHYGSSKIETARNAFYICKYTGKGYQKEKLPVGARMFAVQIYAESITDAEMIEFRMSTLPTWLRNHVEDLVDDFGNALRWGRAEGGGWIIRNTGELVASPYKVREIVFVD